MLCPVMIHAHDGVLESLLHYLQFQITKPKEVKVDRKLSLTLPPSLPSSSMKWFCIFKFLKVPDLFSVFWVIKRKTHVPLEITSFKRTFNVHWNMHGNSFKKSILNNGNVYIGFWLFSRVFWKQHWKIFSVCNAGACAKTNAWKNGRTHDLSIIKTQLHNPAVWWT